MSFENASAAAGACNGSIRSLTLAAYMVALALRRNVRADRRWRKLGPNESSHDGGRARFPLRGGRTGRDELHGGALNRHDHCGFEIVILKPSGSVTVNAIG